MTNKMIVGLLLCLIATTALGAEPKQLVTYKNCTLVPTVWGDADSFLVRFPDGKERTIRLYFADAPEMAAKMKGDASRVREQSRYFGVANPLETMRIGKQAKEFVVRQLEKPFTVDTTLAVALGRSKKQRYYGFVRTADGKDLGELLVANGFARSHGVPRSNAAGDRAKDLEERLDDLEDQAAMSRLGIWKLTDLKEMLRGRETNRQNARLDEQLIRRDPIHLNINRAGIEELKLLPGIGVKTAQQIISKRPYKTLEELDEVPGIGPKTLKAIAPLIRFEDKPEGEEKPAKEE